MTSYVYHIIIQQKQTERYLEIILKPVRGILTKIFISSIDIDDVSK